MLAPRARQTRAGCRNIRLQSLSKARAGAGHDRLNRPGWRLALAADRDRCRRAVLAFGVRRKAYGSIGMSSPLSATIARFSCETTPQLTCATGQQYRQVDPETRTSR